MNSLQTLTFEHKEISTIVDEHGNPWWIAAEVCGILGIGNVTMAVSRLDDDERSTLSPTEGAGGMPRNIITESGLYNLISRSDKPEAKRFRKWVTAEVLPTLRKYGRYDVSIAQYGPDVLEQIETDPSVIQLRKLLEVTQEQVAQRNRLQVVEAKQRQMIDELHATSHIAETALSTAVIVENCYTGRTGFKTALGYSLSKGYSIDRKDLATIGRAISKYCKSTGIDRNNVEDEHYDKVKSYPLSVLEQHDSLFRNYNRKAA